MNICPVCARPVEAVAESSFAIERAGTLREAFVKQRLGHEPEQLEAMDLTRFMHGGPGRLLTCLRCGTLVRDERDRANYRDDLYDSDLMKHLYPRYLRSFEQKKALYSGLLRDGAEVVEVGSHLGAFLEAAEGWGWRPVGLDIGESTSAFARSRGVTVRRQELEDYGPLLKKPEAVFIWNCFEQMEDPAPALMRSHQLLERHGLLVVRVPNAAFYRRNSGCGKSVELLGYNNLLGFPYLHGYTPDALSRLLKRNGFAPVTTHNSSLLTPPYPDLTARLRRDWKAARRRGENAPEGGGPWIEVVSRRV